MKSYEAEQLQSLDVHLWLFRRKWNELFSKKTGLLSDFINRACLLATCSICVAMAI